MNKQKGFIGIGLMIWIIVGLALAGTTVYVVKKNSNNDQRKDYATDPYVEGKAVSQNVTGVNVSGNGQAGIAIDEPGVQINSAVSLSAVLKAKNMPFQVSYSHEWKVRGDNGPSAVNGIPAETIELSTDDAAHFTNASPDIIITGFNAGTSLPGFSYQSAKEYCNDSSPESGVAGMTRKSLVVNGYDACYSFIEKPYATTHAYVLYHNGYFVTLNFEEKYTKGVTTSSGTAVTSYDNSKYLPDFEAVVHSVKFTN